MIGAMVAVYFLATVALGSYCAPWADYVDDPYGNRLGLCYGPAGLITLPAIYVWALMASLGHISRGWPLSLPEQLLMAGLNSLFWGAVLYGAHRLFTKFYCAFRSLFSRRPQHS